jgi:integrase/recombinase XerD
MSNDLGDRILLGCMALQGCRGIKMYRANLGDISQSYGQHYLKLDGKNSIRTIILRPDLAKEVIEYRQARAQSRENLNAV